MNNFLAICFQTWYNVLTQQSHQENIWIKNSEQILNSVLKFLIFLFKKFRPHVFTSFTRNANQFLSGSSLAWNICHYPDVDLIPVHSRWDLGQPNKNLSFLLSALYFTLKCKWGWDQRWVLALTGITSHASQRPGVQTSTQKP